MAVFPNSLLRDLFQNNIDYVAKQAGRILDALYGEQADENSVIPSDNYLFHTVFYYGDSGSNIQGGLRPDNLYAVYQCDIDSYGIDIHGIAECPPFYIGAATQAYKDNLYNVVQPYLASYTVSMSMQDLGIDHWVQGGNDIRGYNGNTQIPLNITNAFGIDTNKTVQKTTLKIRTNNPQSMSVEQGPAYDAYQFVYASPYSGNWTSVGEMPLSCIKDSYNPSSFVIMPSTGSDSVYNVIDNSTVNTYNYNGNAVYNYYNDSGDIIINGGGIGGGGAIVAPVGGLAYINLESILDHLIDDLNLQFNFGGDGDTLPLNYAPTWEELHYIDQGDYYIETLHQYDKLPSAPAFNGDLDLHDYPSFYGSCISTFMGLLPAAFSAALAVGFVVVVMVNKIRR